MIDINLLPWRERNAQHEKHIFKRKMVFSVAAALVVIALSAGGFSISPFIEKRSLSILMSAIEKEQESFERVNQKYQEVVQLSHFISRLHDKEKRHDRLISVLINTVSQRALGIRIDSLLLNDNRLTVNASSFDDQAVHRYVNTLSTMPDLKNIKISHIVINDDEEHFIVEGDVNGSVES